MNEEELLKVEETNVTIYKTSDGKVFNTREEAEINAKKRKFSIWYRSNKIDGVDNSVVFKWLEDNNEAIKLFYSER